jgi:hypothetical protein
MLTCGSFKTCHKNDPSCCPTPTASICLLRLCSHHHIIASPRISLTSSSSSSFSCCSSTFISLLQSLSAWSMVLVTLSHRRLGVVVCLRPSMVSLQRKSELHSKRLSIVGCDMLVTVLNHKMFYKGQILINVLN